MCHITAQVKVSEQLELGVVTSEVSEPALGTKKTPSPRDGGRVVDKESHTIPPTRKRYFPHSQQPAGEPPYRRERKKTEPFLAA